MKDITDKASKGVKASSNFIRRNKTCRLCKNPGVINGTTLWYSCLEYLVLQALPPALGKQLASLASENNKYVETGFRVDFI